MSDERANPGTPRLGVLAVAITPPDKVPTAFPDITIKSE
jgi:hypothetical protein